MQNKELIIYTDLDLAFKIHPVRDDLVMSVNEKAVVRSVRNLVLTNHYERPFQSEIGSNVRKMLFEPITPLTENYIQREIYDVVTAYEPRATNVYVEVKTEPDGNALRANVYFYIENSTTPTIVDMLLERTR
jgi:phage baseplate assembly protein W